MRIAITAGYDRSPPAIALCELLQRAGHEIVAVIVVSPYNRARLKTLLLQRGVGGLRAAARKLFGPATRQVGEDPLHRFVTNQGIETKSLKRWCRAHPTAYATVADINGADAVASLSASKADLVVYAGGGILRKPFLEAARRRVLNPHCGPLPEIRGMNAIEWAVLLQCDPSITLHYIDEGIDTGAVISRVPVGLVPGESVDQLRARAVVTGIEEIAARLALATKPEDLPAAPLANPGSQRQCFVMAPALRELLAHRLETLR